MKSKLSLISLSLLIGLLLGFLPGANQVALAATQELYVCSSGCPYSSIQAAVDAASAGAIIKIAAGTYSGVTKEVYYNQNINQAVLINNKSLTLDGGYTPSNWTTSNPAVNVTTIDAQGKGRVLYISIRDKNVTIKGLHLINGDATKSADILTFDGGGVYADGWVTTSTITFINDQISGNTTNDEGAGLRLWGMTVTMTGNIISNNSIVNANGNGVDGGGLMLDTDTAQITNNQFINNSVPIGDYYGDGGGGVYVRYSTVTLTGNTFTGNQAEQGGGLTEMRASMTVSGNQFISNSASDGGGLYFGPDNDASITLNLTGNTFSGNTVLGNGGGAYLAPYQVTASYNSFDNNTTTAISELGCGGAGLYVGGSNLVVVNHNTISNNVSNTAGGGLCVVGLPVVEANLITGNHAPNGGGVAVIGSGLNPDQNPLLINNVLNGNQVTGDGSAIYIGASSLTLIFNTISSNLGGDASIWMAPDLFSEYGALTMTNTIIDHQATGVNVTHGYTATINGVLWSSVTTPYKSTDLGAVPVQNQITGDPKFAVDGYHILPGSAAIDHGVTSTITTDIDGLTRPYGAGFDLGADEWMPIIHLYLPLIVR